MAVYTGSPRYAERLLPPEVVGRLDPVRSVEPDAARLLDVLMKEEGQLLTAPFPGLAWTHLFLSETSSDSNYDRLIELARQPGGLPDRIASQVGSGEGFHGFKGRFWAALPGNIHLAVHLAPNREVERFEVAFTVLAAVSVVDALEAAGVDEGASSIKWVNDILLGGAKVGGVLAYTQTQDRVVTAAILGMGINVETKPEVIPTPFVPRATCVREHLPGEAPDAEGPVLLALLEALDTNYRMLLDEGLQPLLARYRERSMVLGKEVTIGSELSDRSLQAVAEGRVVRIGDNLELFLEGRPEPVRGGRLVLGRTHSQRRQA